MAWCVNSSEQPQYSILIRMPVPNHDEVEFVLEILDKIAAPALDKVETLLETVGKWDNVARNDFCR